MTYNIKDKAFKRTSTTIKPNTSQKWEIQYGEGIHFEGNDYFYSTPGKNIPKNKVTYVKREYDFWGRENGEKEYLILFYDPKQKDFVILEVVKKNFMKTYQNYTNLNFEQACFFASKKVVDKQREKEKAKQNLEDMLKLNNGDIF